MHNSRLLYKWFLVAIVNLFIGVTSKATVHVVTDNGDVGPNTLRGKIAGALPNDTIVFGDTMTVRITSPISIGIPITIISEGAKHTTIDAQNLSRLFDFVTYSGDTTFIYGIHFLNGSGSGFRVNAPAAFYNCFVENCNSFANGGAFYCNGIDGDLLLHSSSVVGCSSGGNGGAVYIENFADVTIVNSTISNNTASGKGGGVYSLNSPDVELIFYSSTIAANTANNGGGVFLEGSPSVVVQTAHSSIFADNIDVGNSRPDYDNGVGSTITGNNNIIENGATVTGVGNQFGDPKLLSLRDNGRFIPTHGLDPTSIAIDQGNNSFSLDLDQRGAPRVLDGTKNSGYIADVGAFEYTPFCVVNDQPSGVGSLDQAIQDANANLGRDYICFDIPGSGPHLINTTGLTFVLDAAVIDGYSQPESYFASHDYPADIRIEIRYGGGPAFGLVFQSINAINSEVKGLSITNYAQAGISSKGVNVLKIHGNNIGVRPNGTNILGNGDGIRLENGGIGCMIGGEHNFERNIIAGNTLAGVNINGAQNTFVLGNYIGVAGSGNFSSFSNLNAVGVLIQNGSTSNYVGILNGKGNVVSNFSNGDGIKIIDSGTTNNHVESNIIGLLVDGLSSAPNNNGISIGGGADDISVLNNIIARNGNAGVLIGDPNTNSIILKNNFVGVDKNQGFAGNKIGISIFNAASSITIGGIDEGNVISGNTKEGIEIRAGGSDIGIFGNYIGTDNTATLDIGNSENGIKIDSTTSPVSIGGSLNVRSNYIVANNKNGISLANDLNIVQGNFIGINSLQDTLGNGIAGIFISGDKNIIGDSDIDNRNIVSGNKVGIEIKNGNDNLIHSNFIGTDSTGTTSKGNTGQGLFIYGESQRNTVQATPIAPCLISGSGITGVTISGTGTAQNEIYGAFVGTDISGLSSIPNNIGIQIDKDADRNQIGGISGETTLVSGNDSIGILFLDVDSNLVIATGIGVDITLDNGLPNTFGIIIDDSSVANTIGGITNVEENVISGNLSEGIRLKGNGTNRNKIIGNQIGTNKAGIFSVANGGGGVVITGEAKENEIGGSNPGERNIISGNLLAGIAIADTGTTGNKISGNKIGTDITGAFAIGNLVGIYAQEADSNIIGGPTTFGNIISGNDSGGVVLDLGADHNQIIGNLIGVDATGLDSIPNDWIGIWVQNSSNNLIGDSISIFKGNIISSNQSAGVLIEGANSLFNEVYGNKIGTDRPGNNALPNKGAGVVIANDAKFNIIGDEGPVRGNLISGNSDEGLYIYKAHRNIVLGNIIGPAGDGATYIGVQKNGIHIDSASIKNTIGGSISAKKHNIISGNDTVGLAISLNSDSNIVVGNYIGLDLTGTNDLGNLFGLGIIEGSQHNTIGSVNPDLTNYIGGNDSIGIGILGTGANFNEVIGNYIGTGVTTTEQLGSSFGVYIADGAANNRIGGEINTNEGNHITDNLYGVIISGSNTSNDSIIGNKIGVDTSGTIAQANTIGIAIGDGSKDNIVYHNHISGNDTAGIVLAGFGTVNNNIFSNIIGPNKNISNSIASQQVGVYIGEQATDNTIGGNNFPTSANIISGNVLAGVGISGSGTLSNKVLGNYIGCDSLVDNSIPNLIGVLITDSAQGNIVGGDIENYPNYISGNDSIGVLIADTTTNLNTVAGNYIGTKINGYGSLSNEVGVQIDFRATFNFVGDTLNSIKRNIISGNSSYGVSIGGNTNFIAGNYIGVDSTGTNALANQEGGLLIYGGGLNTIGGNLTNKGNIISGNIGNGITVTGGAFNSIRKNLIGIDIDTSIAVPNTANGISIEGGSFLVIGGSQYQYGNIIAGNDSNGVFIGSSGGAHYINANFIGTDTSGTKILGNNLSGVAIDGSNFFANVIGDSITSNPENTIAFNNKGITVKSSTRNGLYRNKLYRNTSLGIDLSDDGLDINDNLDVDNGGNNKQNHPVVLYAVKTNNGIGVQGFINSQANTTYWLEFFGNFLTSTDDEAREYLGAFEVTTNATGYASFSEFLTTTTNIDIGDSVRATASNGHNTSELGAQVVVTTTPNPPIAPNDTAYCENDTAMAYLVPTGILDSAEVRWYVNTIDSVGFVGNDSILPDTTIGKTTYYVTQTVGQVESLPDSVCVTINPSIDSLSIDSIQHVICAGDSLGLVTLSANGGTPPYLFINITNADTGTSTSSFTFDSLKAGSYFFFVTDSLDCGFDTISVTITEPNPIFLQLDSIDVLCNGQSSGQAFVIATGGTTPYTYNWSNSASGDTITNLIAGIYTVTVTDDNGCTHVDSIVVNEPLPLSIDFIDTTHVLCAGDSTGAFSIVVTGGVGAYGANVTGQNLQSFILEGDTTTYDTLTAGTYYITITDQNGCTLVDSINISEPNSINVSFGSLSATCNNSCTGEASVGVSGGASPYSYLWSTAENIANATELCPGYNYITITDANNCAQIDSVFIDTFMTPSVFISPDTVKVCEGECVNIQMEFTGNGGPYYVVYEYDSLNITITDTTNTAFNDTVVEVCPPNLITNFRTLVVHDLTTGCTSDTIGQEIEFIVEPKPLAPLTNGDTLICVGDVASFWKERIITSDSTYWLDENSTLISAEDSLSIRNLEPGTYNYYAVRISQTDLECVSEPTIHTVTVIEPAEAEAEEDITICSALSAQLSATGGTNYQWEPSETLDNDTSANPVASPTATTLYYVTITTTERCQIIDSVLVTVDDSEDCGFHIYNAFSPNNDGDNDVWIIDGIERFPTNKVMLFNRWGDKVNEFDNYNNTTIVWDGAGNSGSNLPDGTYFYIVEIPEIQKKLSSWVQLTR